MRTRVDEIEGPLPPEPGLRREEFLRLLQEHTRLTHPALCPELRTREAVALLPAWEAAEAFARTPVEPPFWAYSWAGSQALSRYIIDHPGEFCGRLVLDLGCGNAIAGIASCLAGADRVIANDIDPAALWMAEITASLNLACLEVEGRDLLAGAPQLARGDVILVGDLFYSRPLGARVAGWIDAAWSAGAVVYVGDPGRAYLPAVGLEPLVEYIVPVSLEIESREELRTRVFRLSDPGGLQKPGPSR